MDPEEEAEKILQEIDDHDLSSSSKVARSTTRDFWEVIRDGLHSRLAALAIDDISEADGGYLGGDGDD